eukprot:Pgem_evm1s17317
MSPTHLISLKEYIDKALKKKWISPSKSPLGAGVFFVPKPNNKLRITVKDKFPIPLISQMMDNI